MHRQLLKDLDFCDNILVNNITNSIDDRYEHYSDNQNCYWEVDIIKEIIKKDKEYFLEQYKDNIALLYEYAICANNIEVLRLIDSIIDVPNKDEIVLTSIANYSTKNNTIIYFKYLLIKNIDKIAEHAENIDKYSNLELIYGLLGFDDSILVNLSERRINSIKNNTKEDKKRYLDELNKKKSARS